MEELKPIRASQSRSRTVHPWWQGGVVYQIYVRSFYDSNGDGIGDLAGVLAKLDYIVDLGVDAIWLSPITVSSNVDWGYDVVDYYNIDPALGTMEDFERLLEACNQKGLRLLMDLVPNHTSSLHPWFQNALSGRDAKYRDYYIWADPKPGNKPPSNWKSFFGGSEWAYDESSRQYYLHNFFKDMPSLNWRNEKVRAEFDQIMRHWLDKGVSGFRIDVFNMLIKDLHFRDNPPAGLNDSLEIKLLGQKPTYNLSRPEVHKILKHWRQLADGYDGDRLLLGETTLEYNISHIASFYGEQDELELAFNFNYLFAKFTADSLSEVIDDTESAIKAPDWPVWANSNHDQPRFASRWAHGDERKIRCGLLVLVALRGTPVLYYGDELGMTNTFVPPWRLKDRVGKKFWPVDAGRDKARSPMPWQHKIGAGFTRRDVRPWLPYGELRHKNVNDQLAKKDTTLRFTRALVGLRKSSPDLKWGDYKKLAAPNDVWLWRRGQSTLVAINMSNHAKDVIDVTGRVILGTLRTREGRYIDGVLKLKPWEGVVIQS